MIFGIKMRIFMLFAYARVSTKEQNLERQIQKSMTLGIDSRYIFVEKESGRSFQRPQYQLVLQMLHPGDLLYINALVHSGRNYDKVIEDWRYWGTWNIETK
ncbi:resolvase protein [Enterococcus faecalis LA3B-2]|nr:resolvase protein [Enterococcus faecalis LA3B-2]